MTVIERPAHVPDDLVVDFDIYDHRPRPPICTRHLARSCSNDTPIAWTHHSGGHWILTRYDDILAVLKDFETYSSFPTAVPRSIHENAPDDPDRLRPTRTHRLPVDDRLAVHPPGHPRARSATSGDLRCHSSTSSPTRGECEFVSEFARPLPSTLFLVMMGWPVEDSPLFNDWSHAILLGKPGGTPEESDEARMNATMEVFGYFGPS